MRIFIRPVFDNPDSGVLPIGYALCARAGELLSDGDILDHFDVDYTGKEIEAAAMEFHGATLGEVRWAGPLYTNKQGV